MSRNRDAASPMVGMLIGGTAMVLFGGYEILLHNLLVPRVHLMPWEFYVAGFVLLVRAIWLFVKRQKERGKLWLRMWIMTWVGATVFLLLPSGQRHPWVIALFAGAVAAAGLVSRFARHLPVRTTATLAIPSLTMGLIAFAMLVIRGTGKPADPKIPLIIGAVMVALYLFIVRRGPGAARRQESEAKEEHS